MRNLHHQELGSGVVLGVLLGSLLGYAAAQAELAPFSNDTIVGAVIGSIIAGAISFGTQILIFRDNRSQRVEAEQSNKRALLQTVFVSLLAYFDHVQKLHNYYRTFEFKEEVFVNGKPLLKKPLRGNQMSFALTRDERSALIDVRDAALINQLFNIENMSALLTFLEDHYVALYDAFEGRQRSQGEVTLEGGLMRASSMGHPIEMLELTDGLEKLRNALRRALPQAKDALFRVIELLRKYDRTISIDIDDSISGASDLSG